MMWGSPLYAVNMFIKNCLIKKLHCAYGRVEYSKAGIPSKDGEKRRQSQRDAKGDIYPGTLFVNRKSCGRIQNNRNGLIQDVRVR